MSNEEGAKDIEKHNKILIVDDEPALLQQLQEILDFHKISAVIAESVQKGFELLDSDQFDILICDIRLPGMSGLNFLEAIRHKGILTPVVFYSGFYETDMLKEAMKLGAFDFIEKPISEKKLLEVIAGATEFSVLQRKIAEVKDQNDSKSKKVIKECEQKINQLRPRKFAAMTPHREEQ